MQEYKQRFTEFLSESGALKFGEFTLKSGRVSPYFFSTASFYSGSATAKLAEFYADAINSSINDDFDIIFGPAYKGIPLCVSVSLSLYSKYKINKQWCFDRKEEKTHGDGKLLVGAPLSASSKIILIDDVMTTGGAKEEAIEKIKSIAPKAQINGVFIAFDRQEKDAQGNNAIKEFEKRHKTKVYSIINADEAFSHLKAAGSLIPSILPIYEQYKKKWGV